MQAAVAQRTMTDGTLARVFLQPQCLNQTLPPSEHQNVSFHGIGSGRLRVLLTHVRCLDTCMIGCQVAIGCALFGDNNSKPATTEQ